MKPDVILCHYSEIGLKGKNRGYFEKKLQDNIRISINRKYPDSFRSIGRLYGRLLIQLTVDGQNNVDALSDILKHVCGIAFCAPALRIKQDLEVMKDYAVQMMSDGDFNSFRITARRTDKNFPFSTQKINEEIGAAVLVKTGKKVNLKNPEKTCFIDLVDGSAFLYTEKIKGQGGLPVGVSGKVISMLSGGIDSPVASYYAMKRGAAVSFVHFHSVPYTNEASIEKVREMVETLQVYQSRTKLFLVELAPIQKEIMVETNPKFRVLLYRRFMVRIAEVLAWKAKAKALYTGESLGQVASQTLENLGVVEQAVNLPILRPLIGFDKLDIIHKAQSINTYDISILPDQDCCSLFTPRHPATKARLNDVLGEEKKLDVDQMISTAINSIETEYFE